AYETFEQNCYLSKSIGADKMVIHLWDGRTSDTAIENNLDHYAVLDQTAQNYDIDLCVENVVCTTDNPIKHFCALRQRYPKIHFVFDTKMAAFHHQLELLYNKEYEWLWKNEHICHYHLNDYAGGYMDWRHLQSLPVGKGAIDFDAFFAFMKKIGYQHTYTVEAAAVQPDNTVDVNLLNEQFQRIQDIGLSTA
ncbi:MAG: sugar phosphate isomerase/epimerase, partial [Lachnospiraceae bacterium]|nr:sugar phosphate isomerase/epimerase [Lachnospiraceae bacterium]